MAKTHLAVLGSPIEHSKSPLIHAAAYSALGLEWDYGRYRIEANELESFLKLRDTSWRGFSLTMPLKEVGFELSIPSCPVASETGIVNTLLHTDIGWEGYNTDSFGIQQALRSHGAQVPQQVSILGSGATAISAVHAVKQLNPSAEIEVFARRSVEIDGISSRPLEHFYSTNVQGLTISTLPGTVMHPKLQVATDAVILDVAYSPWPSKLASSWAKDNRISGLEMLLWQALIQVRIFYLGDGSVELPNESEVFEAMRASVQA
jgi:shikimate dehydrogenase